MKTIASFWVYVLLIVISAIFLLQETCLAEKVAAPAVLFRSHNHIYSHIFLGICLAEEKAAIQYWFNDDTHKHAGLWENKKYTEQNYKHEWRLECWASEIKPLQMKEFYSEVTNGKHRKLFVEFNYESVTYKLAFDIRPDNYLPASYIWLDNYQAPIGTPLICLNGCFLPDYSCAPYSHLLGTRVTTISAYCVYKSSCLKNPRDSLCVTLEKEEEVRRNRLEKPGIIAEQTANVIIAAGLVMLDSTLSFEGAMTKRFIKTALPRSLGEMEGIKILDTKFNNTVTIRGPQTTQVLEGTAFKTLRGFEKTGKTGAVTHIGSK